MLYFQTGSLDSLVILSDQLAKLDPQLEGTVARFVTNLKSLLEDDDVDTIKDNLLVNDRKEEQNLIYKMYLLIYLHRITECFPSIIYVE